MRVVDLDGEFDEDVLIAEIGFLDAEGTVSVYALSVGGSMGNLTSRSRTCPPCTPP